MRMIIFCLAIISVSWETAFGLKTYTVGVQDFKEYLPYSEVIGNEYRGFNRVVLDKFSKSIGVEFVYKILPLKRLYSEFFGNKVDFKYPDNPYWLKKEKVGKKILYSKPMVQYIDGVFTLPSKGIDDVSDLRTLGTVLGFTPFPYRARIESGTVELGTNRSVSSLIAQVEKNRVDGAYANIAVAQHYISKTKMREKITFNTKLPYKKSTRHLSTIFHRDLVVLFDHFLVKEESWIKEKKNDFKVEPEAVSSGQ